MAIVYGGGSTFYTGASNTETINISLPNIANGSLWIVWYTEIAFGGTPTFEAGWQQLLTPSNSGGQLGKTYILYRVREAGDNTTFTTTYPSGFGRQVCAVSYGYSGTAVNAPFDTFRSPFDEGAGTNPPSQAITTTTTNTMILRMCNFDDGDGVGLPISFPAGVTNRGSVDVPDPPSGGNGGYMRCGEDGIQAAIGSTGVATWTQQINEGWTTMTLAIRDAANDITIPVDSSLTVDYDILLPVDNNVTLDYDILLPVDNNLTLVYDQFQKAENDLTSLYAMGGLTSNNLTSLYAMGGVTSNDLTLKYNVINPITFVGSAEYYGGTTNSETHNVTLPNIPVGSLWVMFYVGISFSGDPTFEAGWNILPPVCGPDIPDPPPTCSQGQLGTARILYKIRDGGDNLTMTVTYPVGQGRQVAAITCGYSGTATQEPFDPVPNRNVNGGSWDIGESDNPISESITTVTEHTMILRWMTADDDDTATEGVAFPPGVTNRGWQDISGAGAGGGGHFGFGEQGIQVSAGATGTKTWTLDPQTGSEEDWQTQTIAIRNVVFDIQQVDSSLTLDYDILDFVDNNLTLDYDILLPVDNNLTLDYDMRELASNNLTLLYAMAGVVSNNITLDYDIIGRVDNNLTLNYDMFGSVINNLTLNYDILNLVDNNVTLDYDILSLVDNNLILNYAVFELASNNLTLLYDMAGVASNSITVNYDIIERVDNNLTLDYDILLPVDNNLTLDYDIFNLANNSITLLYDMIEEISNSITLDYDIIEQVNNNLTLDYDIFNLVDNNLTVDYDVFEFVDSSVTINYDVLNLIDNSITNRWAILQVFCTSNNMFDRQLFGDLQQFDTTLCLEVTINEPAVVVSDDANRVSVLARAIGEGAVSIGGDVIARALILGRAMIDTTIITDIVSRSLILKRTIIDGAVSISDTIDSRVAIPSKVFFDSRIKELLDFASRIKEDLNFISRIKEDEDVSI